MQRNEESGSALFTATVMIVALAAIVATLVHLTTSEHARSRSWREETRAFYVAQAGANEAFATLAEGGLDALLALDYPRGLGEASYSVDVVLGADDAALEDDRVRLIASGVDGRSRARIEVIARVVPAGGPAFAAFGLDGVRLSSNVFVDSFDSSQGAYPGGPAGTMGNLGSNGDVVLASNVDVYGDVVPGPDGVMIAKSNVYVWGATASASANVELEPITVPALETSGSLSFTGTRTIGPGDTHYAAITVKSNGLLRLIGPATLVVDDFALLSNSDLVIDDTGGPVAIYGTGDFELRSNSSLTTLGGRAREVAIFLTGDTDAKPAPTIDFRSNGTFVGTIYAPDADVVISSNFHVFGSITAESIELSSNVDLHYDEDLQTAGGGETVVEQVSWRVLGAAAP